MYNNRLLALALLALLFLDSCSVEAAPSSCPISSKSLPASPLALEWQQFYRKYFDIPIGFNNVYVPDPAPDYFDIFVPATISLNDVVRACRKLFKVSTVCDDLILKKLSNRREPLKIGSYFVRFRKRADADEEYKKFSAGDLDARGIEGITLLERMILELYYFTKTGQHLDIASFTLCSGSCYPNGVPFVFWYEVSDVCDQLSIGFCSIEHSLYDLRVREVIPYDK